MHDKFTLTVTMEVCGGMKAKVLEEVRKWRLYTQSNFDHGTDVKIYVDHKEINNA